MIKMLPVLLVNLRLAIKPVQLALASALMLAASHVGAQTLIRDAEAEHYFDAWTREMFQAAGLGAGQVEMFIISSDQLNAFVSGGQNIFMHTEILRRAATLDQVLAVVAHEAGHIIGGHLTRANDQLAAAQLKALAVTILGIGASIATGDSTAGVLGSALGSDLAKSGYYSFSRAQESSADQAAVNLLSRIGLPPNGAAEFMRVLDRESRFYSNGGRSYATTHPLTSTRITAMENAVTQSRLKGRKVPALWADQYERMRAKFIGYERPYNEVLRRYPRADNSIPARYARAIADYRRGDLRAALVEMDALLTKEPGNPFFHELKGQALFESGYLPQSVYAYQQAVALRPNEPLILDGLARALIGQSDPASIQRGIGYINSALAFERDNAGFWRTAATGYGRIGQLGQSSLALAEASFAVGKYADAVRLARQARQRLPQASASARRASDIERIAKQQQGKR